MSKLMLVAMATAFAMISVVAPAMAAKKKSGPGLCGEFMFFDKKSKACKDKRA